MGFPDLGEIRLPVERWSYQQFSRFLRESHPQGPKLRSFELPTEIDTGTIGEVSDKLIIATNNYGPLPKRKERARYMRIEREPSGAFVYSQEWIGSWSTLSGTELPPITSVEESKLKEGIAFLMHSHVFPSVFFTSRNFMVTFTASCITYGYERWWR